MWALDNFEGTKPCNAVQRRIGAKKNRKTKKTTKRKKSGRIMGKKRVKKERRKGSQKNSHVRIQTA